MHGYGSLPPVALSESESERAPDDGSEISGWCDRRVESWPRLNDERPPAVFKLAGVSLDYWLIRAEIWEIREVPGRDKADQSPRSLSDVERLAPVADCWSEMSWFIDAADETYKDPNDGRFSQFIYRQKDKDTIIYSQRFWIKSPLWLFWSDKHDTDTLTKETWRHRQGSEWNALLPWGLVQYNVSTLVVRPWSMMLKQVAR